MEETFPFKPVKKLKKALPCLCAFHFIHVFASLPSFLPASKRAGKAAIRAHEPKKERIRIMQESRSDIMENWEIVAH